MMQLNQGEGVNGAETSKSSESESWSLSDVVSSFRTLSSLSSRTNLAKEIFTREIFRSFQSTTVGLTARNWWAGSFNSSTSWLIGSSQEASTANDFFLTCCGGWAFFSGKANLPTSSLPTSLACAPVFIGLTWPVKRIRRERNETYFGISPFKAKEFFQDIVLICQIECIIVLKQLLVSHHRRSQLTPLYSSPLKICGGNTCLWPSCLLPLSRMKLFNPCTWMEYGWMDWVGWRTWLPGADMSTIQ